MSIINIARRCFASVDDDGFIKNDPTQAQQKQAQKKEEEQTEKVDMDITPLLDKTQLANIDDIDWVFPESFYKALQVDNDDDKILVIDGIRNLSSLWKICSAVAGRKDWIINKADVTLLQRLVSEVKARDTEKIYILFTISDTDGHSYVFWLVNPSVIEGQFSCKVQEQTFGTDYEVSNTSVISIKHKDGDEPGDYAIEPIIDEFAKEDKTVKEEAQSILEAAEEVPAEEEDEFSDWEEDDVFAEDSGEGEEEVVGEVEETSEKNFSRAFRVFFT